MKKILITITALLIGFTSFAQLDMGWVKDKKVENGYEISKRFSLEIDNLIQTIYQNNSIVADHQMFIYDFDDGYKYAFAYFLDKNAKFLGIINFDRKGEGDTSLWGIDSYNESLQYWLNRHIVDFNTNYDDYYKIIFNDGTFISIEFNKTKYYKERYENVNYCKKQKYKIYLYDTYEYKFFNYSYFSLDNVDCNTCEDCKL